MEKKLSLSRCLNQLYNVIPGGKIVVEPENQTQRPENGVSKDPALIQCILEAVEKHEEAVSLRGLWN